jgi:hypothetical protein
VVAQAGYMPSPGPPTNDPGLLQVIQWTQRELENLARQFTNFDVMQQNVLSEEPDKPRDGLTVIADGVNWNPGHGAGQYTFLNGVWVFGGYQDTSGFLLKTANLSDVANKVTALANLDPQLTSVIRVTSISPGTYTLLLTDGEKMLLPNAGGAFTIVIPNNATVPFPVGTCVSMIATGGAMTVQIQASDILYQVMTAAQGTRSIASWGLATIWKLSATQWVISGSGIS